LDFSRSAPSATLAIVPCSRLVAAASVKARFESSIEQMRSPVACAAVAPDQRQCQNRAYFQSFPAHFRFPPQGWTIGAQRLRRACDFGNVRALSGRAP
jgi:hypothetical protein